MGWDGIECGKMRENRAYMSRVEKKEHRHSVRVVEIGVEIKWGRFDRA